MVYMPLGQKPISLWVLGLLHTRPMPHIINKDALGRRGRMLEKLGGDQKVT